MKNLYAGFQAFLNDEEGVTAIEYGLIAALIAVVIITAVGLVGTNLDTEFRGIADCIKNGATGTLCAAL